MMTELARAARDNIAKAAPMMRFGRLRKSFRFVVTRDRVVVYSIYYWARWVNDGRRGIQAQPGRKLVFFKDPAKDPRIKTDYPRRSATAPRLTRRQFYTALEKGQLIVTESVGPADGYHFIEKGIRATREEVPAKMRELIRGDVRRLIRRGREKIVARF